MTVLLALQICTGWPSLIPGAGGPIAAIYLIVRALLNPRSHA